MSYKGLEIARVVLGTAQTWERCPNPEFVVTNDSGSCGRVGCGMTMMEGVARTLCLVEVQRRQGSVRNTLRGFMWQTVDDMYLSAKICAIDSVQGFLT